MNSNLQKKTLIRQIFKKNKKSISLPMKSNSKVFRTQILAQTSSFSTNFSHTSFLTLANTFLTLTSERSYKQYTVLQFPVWTGIKQNLFVKTHGPFRRNSEHSFCGEPMVCYLQAAQNWINRKWKGGTLMFRFLCHLQQAVRGTTLEDCKCFSLSDDVRIRR